MKKSKKDCDTLAEAGLCIIDTEMEIDFYKHCSMCNFGMYYENIIPLHYKVNSKKYAPFSPLLVYRCGYCGTYNTHDNPKFLQKRGEILYKSDIKPTKGWLKEQGFTKQEVFTIGQYLVNTGEKLNFNRYNHIIGDETVVGYEILANYSVYYIMADGQSVDFRYYHKSSLNSSLRTKKEKLSNTSSTIRPLLTTGFKRLTLSGLVDFIKIGGASDSEFDIFKAFIKINYPELADNSTHIEVEDMYRNFYKELHSTFVGEGLEKILPKSSRDILNSAKNKDMVNGFHPGYCDLFEKWMSDIKGTTVTRNPDLYKHK